MTPTAIYAALKVVIDHAGLPRELEDALVYQQSLLLNWMLHEDMRKRGLYAETN